MAMKVADLKKRISENLEAEFQGDKSLYDRMAEAIAKAVIDEIKENAEVTPAKTTLPIPPIPLTDSLNVPIKGIGGII